MKEAIEIIDGMIELFGPKGEHWGVLFSAVDHRGREVDSTDDMADRWCLAGALTKCTDGNDEIAWPVEMAIRDACANWYATEDYPVVNDRADTTFDDILRILRTAREMLVCEPEVPHGE